MVETRNLLMLNNKIYIRIYNIAEAKDLVKILEETKMTVSLSTQSVFCINMG